MIERDGKTGIEREIRTGYSKSEYLLGATVIPSNSGQLGGQRGVNLDDPLPVVIDPDTPDEIRLSSTDMRSRRMQELLKEHGSALAAYRAYAKEKKEKEVEVEMAKKNDTVMAAAPQPDRPERKKKVEKTSVPQPSAQLPDELQQMLLTMAKAAVAQPITRLPPTTPAETGVTDLGPLPSELVTFQDPAGNLWQTRWHRHCVYGNTLVLVLDTGFKLAQISLPAVSDKTIYVVSLQGTPGWAVRWLGQRFADGPCEYYIFVIAEAEAEAD